jgi:cell division protein FtsQ
MAKKRGTRRSSINKRRKGVLAYAIPWLKRFGMIGGACVVVLWAGAWFFLSDVDQAAAGWVKNKTLEVTSAAGFQVRDILVEGRVHTSPEILKAIINVKKGDPLFLLDPVEAQELIERISWVRSAQVERRLPGTVYIGLEERVPLALWQKNREVRLLDSRGEVIEALTLEPFKDLVMVMGEGAPEAAPLLLENLVAVPDIYPRVKLATRISNRRWDLRMKNGVVVKLPEEDPGLTLVRLAEAQGESELLDKGFVTIDLREGGRITVRTKPGGVREYKAGLNMKNEI